MSWKLCTRARETLPASLINYFSTLLFSFLTSCYFFSYCLSISYAIIPYIKLIIFCFSTLFFYQCIADSNLYATFVLSAGRKGQRPNILSCLLAHAVYSIQASALRYKCSPMFKNVLWLLRCLCRLFSDLVRFVVSEFPSVEFRRVLWNISSCRCVP